MNLRGPAFEPASHSGFLKVNTDADHGAHWSIFKLDNGRNNRPDPDIGMESLRSMFPSPRDINAENFVLFSTSGVHGSYTTLEEIEECIAKFGEDFDPGDDEPEGFCGYKLTILIVQPRIVCLRYGNVRVRLEDIPYLRDIRSASRDALMQDFEV